MTDKQKEQIHRLRWRGISYKEISCALHIPEGSVRSYCTRNSLSSDDISALEEVRRDFAIAAICKHCGQPIEQSGKYKPKQFCSDKCRYRQQSRRCYALVPEA